MDTLRLWFLDFHSVYKLLWNIYYGFSEKESFYYRQEIITAPHCGSKSTNDVYSFLKEY